MATATIVYQGEFPRLLENLNGSVTKGPQGLLAMFGVEAKAARVDLRGWEDKNYLVRLSKVYGSRLLAILWPNLPTEGDLATPLPC